MGELDSQNDEKAKCRNQNILEMQALLFDRMKVQAPTPEVQLVAEEVD